MGIRHGGSPHGGFPHGGFPHGGPPMGDSPMGDSPMGDSFFFFGEEDTFGNSASKKEQNTKTSDVLVAMEEQ